MKKILICQWVAMLVLSLTVAASSSAYAAESEARQALEQTVNIVLNELDNPGLHTAATRDTVLAKVEQTILQLFDSEELSYRTVGPNWRTFTPDQKKRFTDAFTTLLRETYLEKLEGYDGEKVVYTGEESNADKTRSRIQTVVKVKNKDVSVTYSMVKKDRWVVYDVTIEGVSMVKNYRTQFQDLLVKGDPEALINQVITKAEEVKEHNKKAQTGSV